MWTTVKGKFNPGTLGSKDQFDNLVIIQAIHCHTVYCQDLIANVHRTILVSRPAPKQVFDLTHVVLGPH